MIRVLVIVIHSQPLSCNSRQRQFDTNFGSAPRGLAALAAADVESASQQFHPFPHAGEPEGFSPLERRLNIKTGSIVPDGEP